MRIFAFIAWLVFFYPISASAITILALGDSLTSGYGLKDGEGFAPQLEQALRAKGYDARVINAGVPGDTSADGLARLDWSLAENPDLVLVEFGANDALRGLDPDFTKANIDTMIRRVKDRGYPLLLLGMKAPRNLGAPYIERFDRIYADLAKTHDVPLYEFFLEGVAVDPVLNQPDGLHPNSSGVKEIVARLLPVIEARLAK